MAHEARFRAVARSGILSELPTLTTVKVFWQLLLLRDDEEITPGRLADLCGVDNQNLNRAANYLTILGLAERPRSSVWRLPAFDDERVAKTSVLRMREAADFVRRHGASLGTHAGLTAFSDWASTTTLSGTTISQTLTQRGETAE